MAGLQQLKGRLRSVKISKQLASAMKTVASVKYSRLTAMESAYRGYAGMCRQMKKMIEIPASSNDDALPRCIVVVGSNKGLCGSYNSELRTYAEDQIVTDANRLLIVTGKNAISYFSEKNIPVFKEFVLPDVPLEIDCKELTETIKSLYFEGKVKSVDIVFQRYVNTFTQTPATLQIFPYESNGKPNTEDDLVLTDKETFYKAALDKIISSDIYSVCLEAALGAQAATLLAMRTAYDNAETTAEQLQNEINRKRQSAVTAGVLETSNEIFKKGEGS